jgi:hypothetical protein
MDNVQRHNIWIYLNIDNISKPWENFFQIHHLCFISVNVQNATELNALNWRVSVMTPKIEKKFV